MATRAKSRGRRSKGGRKPAEVLRNTWNATLEALSAAEQDVERQVKLLLKKNKISGKDARTVLKNLGSRFQTERRKAAKEIEGRLSTLQARVKKERKAAGRALDDAVKGALAAFNIPSRHEVAQLTRKVEELSRKIDSVKRRPARASRPKPAPAETTPAFQG